jgi:hypothetical protein
LESQQQESIMIDRDKLIDQETGEIDWMYLKRRALLRADREFGGPGAPNSYVRDAIAYFKDAAEYDRKEWRKAHGVADDTQYVLMTPAFGGASGDSFAR